MGNPESRALHYFCVGLGICTFLLIVAGGLVTSQNAGLSVPDWPLSYGRWMPQMVGGIFYEHGHRMIATTVGFLIIVLNVWLWMSGARRPLRILGLTALIAVIVQGVLGGLTVLLELPVYISVFHACLAQIVFCIVVTLALLTSRLWQRLDSSEWVGQAPSFEFARFLTAAIFVQVILGAALRHSGTVDGVKALHLNSMALVLHILGACIVSLLIAISAFPVLRGSVEGLAARFNILLSGLLVIQLGLGMGALIVRLGAPTRIQPMPVDVAITTGHLALGSLMLALSLMQTMVLWGNRGGSGRAPVILQTSQAK